MICFRRLPSAVFVVGAVFVFGIAYLWHRNGNPGWDRPDFLFAFPRVIAEFFFGTLIYSMAWYKGRYPKWAVIVAVGLTLACFFVSSDRALFFFSITLIPLTVVILSTVRLEGVLRKVCRLLGEMSYPLYVLHFPIYRLIGELLDLKALDPVATTCTVAVACMLVAHAMGVVDARLRKSLMSRFGRRYVVA